MTLRVSLIFIVLAAGCCLGQQTKPLTPNQWVQALNCNKSSEDASWYKVMFGDRCRRDNGAWRWNYMGEIGRPTRVLVQEDSIDERLANNIDTVKLMKTIGLFALRFHSGSELEDARNQELVAGPQVDDRLCGQHLRQMLGQMDDLAQRLELRRNNATHSAQLQERHLHLARVLDSFGRYESGYLSGQSFSIGNYEQCLGSQLMLQDQHGAGKMVDSRFCWAQFNVEKHLHPSLRSKKRISKHIFDKNILSSGICIPSSCHSKSFAANRQLFQELVSQHFKLPKSMYLDEQLELQSVFCLVDQNSSYLNLSTGAVVLIFVVSGWILLIVLGTIYNRLQLRNQDSKHHQNISSLLDIGDSWTDLVRSNRDSNSSHRPVNLDALNGVKVLAYAIIVLGHALMSAYVYSTDIIRSSYEADIDLQTSASRLYFLVVDTFFVVSGLLVGYLGVKRLVRSFDKTNNSERSRLAKLKQFAGIWLSMAVSRYIRVVPLLALLIWFEKTLFIHLGSGPLWDYGLDKDTTAGACIRTSWLRPLNFFSGTNGFLNCSVPSWFIYCDLYAHIIFVPPLVYLLAKRHIKLVYSIVIAIATITSLMAAQQFQALDPGINYEMRELRAIETLMQTDYHLIYVEPLYRVARVLIGLLAGHALYCFNIHSESSQLQGEQVAWPKWIRGCSTWLAIIYLIIVALHTILMPYVKLYLDPLFRVIQLLFITVVPLFWCASKSIIFLRMTTDWQHTWPSRIGSNELIKTLAKLGFAVYLIHWDFFSYTFASTTTIIHYRKWLFYMTFAMAYLYSNCLATIVYVFIENPLAKLSKRFIAV